MMMMIMHTILITAYTIIYEKTHTCDPFIVSFNALNGLFLLFIDMFQTESW